MSQSSFAIRCLRWLAPVVDFSSTTGLDKHSVLLDFDTFVKVGIPDKSDPQRLYDPENFDFRLRPGSAAVDAGLELPTITDDFTGKAPDLGASVPKKKPGCGSSCGVPIRRMATSADAGFLTCFNPRKASELAVAGRKNLPRSLLQGQQPVRGQTPSKSCN